MESIIPGNCDNYDADSWTDSLGIDFDGDDSEDNNYNNCDYTD